MKNNRHPKNISTFDLPKDLQPKKEELSIGDLVIVHKDPPFCKEIEGLARLVSRVENYPVFPGFERWQVRFQGDWRVVDRWVKRQD